MTAPDHQKFTRGALLKGGGALIVVIGVPAAAWRLASDGSDAPTTWPAVLDPSALDSWLADPRRRHGHRLHGQDGSRPGQPDGALADRRRGARRALRSRAHGHGRHRNLRRPGADRGQPDDRPRRSSAPAGGSRRTAGAARPGSDAPRRPGRQAHRRGWSRQRGRRRFAAGLLRRARRWSPARRDDSGQGRRPAGSGSRSAGRSRKPRASTRSSASRCRASTSRPR